MVVELKSASRLQLKLGLALLSFKGFIFSSKFNKNSTCAIFIVAVPRHLAGASVGMTGRKRLINENDLRDIADDITSNAISLNSMTRAEVKGKIQQKIITSKGLNMYANVNEHAAVSNKTINRYLKEMEVSERVGKIKPQSRVEPYLNIRS